MGRVAGGNNDGVNVRRLDEEFGDGKAFAPGTPEAPPRQAWDRYDANAFAPGTRAAAASARLGSMSATARISAPETAFVIVWT